MLSAWHSGSAGSTEGCRLGTKWADFDLALNPLAPAAALSSAHPPFPPHLSLRSSKKMPPRPRVSFRCLIRKYSSHHFLNLG